MKQPLPLTLLGVLIPALASLLFAAEGSVDTLTVGQYRVFEVALENDRPYDNKFTDVDLLIQFQAPSGRCIDFFGFYDGDGEGRGDARTGTVWKARFMPDEVGEWRYVYRWSDDSPGGSGSFRCTRAGGGKGVLRPYRGNPRWFAYNGTEPVWLKSYYETGHGSLGQDFDWIVTNVYQRLVDNGYNHLQVNWLLSLCCFEQYYLDGPVPETLDLALYEAGKVDSTMNLDVWHRMERHLGWLNERDIGVHMFLGVDGSQNEGPAWADLTPAQQDFYVRYMVARLAPFANLAGWNFVWEVEGSRESHELGFARLVEKYDVFEHLRTYEDEFPRENHYHLPAYTFAAVENHGIAAPDKDQERHLWRSAWTHHMACLLSDRGKPVYMSEGNSLWRRFWHERVGATQDDLRRAAWACATAGASFNWNGHEKEYELYAHGPSGLPFGDDHPFQLSVAAIDILSDVMTRSVRFHTMHPHDALLARHEVLEVYLLAEPGQQYLAFSPDGQSFAIRLEPGTYSGEWVDTRTGETLPVDSVLSRSVAEPTDFRPPSTHTDWVLVLRR